MDPKKYDRGSRFAEIQSANPNKPTPGLKLDQEFDKIKSAIDAIGQALGVITRDDGALDNGSVGRDQISSDVSLGFDPPATWEVGKYYRDGKDTCFHASKFWRCEESHSSEAPFDETKWSMVADFAEATTAAETAKIAAEAARDLVLGYKQDAETAATSAETSKNTAETKAAEASQSAVSASNSAQTATTKAAETTQDRSDVATMKTAAETARDQAEAARDAAQAAQPIVASAKGRELVGKETTSEMRDVLGVASGVPIGSMIDWPIDAVPAFWARADGAAFSRATYVDLHNSLAPELTVVITSGSAVMTGLGSAQGFKAGMKVEGAGIPAGATIQSVDGANQITLSANATASGTKCRVYRYGNGDGSTTFNLPSFAGRVSRAWDPSGAINPDESALGVSQEDAFQGHDHSLYLLADRCQPGGNTEYGGGNIVSPYTTADIVSDGNNGQPRVSTETRGKSLIVNKIIKVSGGVDDPAVLAAGSALADIAAAVAKATEVERVAKNKVANFTNVPATYLVPGWADANGLEIPLLTTTIQNVAAGNKVKGAVHIFGEGDNNVTFRITRNGHDLLRGTGGGNNGANCYVSNTYDAANADTPSLLAFNFCDDSPDEGENIYKIVAQISYDSAATFALNRTITGGTGIYNEYGVSGVILEEVSA